MEQMLTVAHCEVTLCVVISVLRQKGALHSCTEAAAVTRQTHVNASGNLFTISILPFFWTFFYFAFFLDFFLY